MKRILWMTAIIASVWVLPRLSHPAVDIGKLDPVETVLLKIDDRMITLETDLGPSGSGETLEEAIRALRKSASSEIYLDTTNKLLISGNADAYWSEIMDVFRPSSRVCRILEEPDLKEATKYLTAHEPELTLNRIRAGERNWEILIIKEGRGQLVPE